MADIDPPIGPDMPGQLRQSSREPAALAVSRIKCECSDVTHYGQMKPITYFIAFGKLFHSESICPELDYRPDRVA